LRENGKLANRKATAETWASNVVLGPGAFRPDLDLEVAQETVIALGRVLHRKADEGDVWMGEPGALLYPIVVDIARDKTEQYLRAQYGQHLVLQRYAFTVSVSGEPHGVAPTNDVSDTDWPDEAVVRYLVAMVGESARALDALDREIAIALFRGQDELRARMPELATTFGMSCVAIRKRVSRLRAKFRAAFPRTDSPL